MIFVVKKAFLLLLALLVLLGGCAAAKSEESLTPGRDNYEYSYDQNGGMVASVETTVPSKTAANGYSTPAASANRKLIYTVSITLETLEYEDTLPALKARCTGAGGYIENSSESGVNLYSSGKRSSTLTMRIPAANLDAFVNDVSLMGNVISNSRGTQDITDTYYDTDAHLKSLQLQEERYLALLEKAEAMEDIITIEQALSNVRYQIESLTGTLQRFDSQVEYSTVTVYLQEVGETTPAEPENFWQRIGNAFTSSIKALWKFAKWCVVALVTVLPFLAIPGLVAGLVLWLVHRRKVRKAKLNNKP